MPFAENLGSGGSALDAQYGSSSAPNTNAPLLLDPRTSGNFVYTTGSAGNYVSVPHADSLNILGTEDERFLSLPGFSTQEATSPHNAAYSGDVMEIRIDIDADNWNPGAFSAMFYKADATTATNTVWTLATNTTNRLQFSISDGTNSATWFQTVLNAAPFTTGGRIRVRCTYVRDTGAGQYELRVFVNNTDFTTPLATLPSWTEIGSPATGASIGATNVGTAPLRIGSRRGTTDPQLAGKYYGAAVIVGGVTVFDADFSTQTIGSRGFIESTGKLVTLTGTQAQIVDGTTYGFLPGVNGSYYSTPDATPLDITGDIDIRARVSFNTYSGQQCIVGKSAGANTGGYEFLVNTGSPRFRWSNAGGETARATTDTLAGVGIAVGQTVWLRATLDVDIGGTDAQVSFYWAPDSPTEPTSWTAFTQPAAEGAPTSIGAGATALALGSYHNGGVVTMSGRIFRVIIRPNITSGAINFDADFTRQIQFTPTFRESSSNAAVVTVNGAARVERARDLEIVTRVAMDDWTASGFQMLLSKWRSSPAAVRSYGMGINPISGTLRLFWTSDNGTDLGKNSTVPLGAVDGQPLWLRASLDVNNGSGGHDVKFFQSPDGVTWTQLGTTVTTAGATSISPTNAPVEIAALSDPAIALFSAGKTFRTIIRNGIGGPAVLDLDFTQAITTGSEAALEPTGPGSPTIPQAVQFAPNLGTGGAALNARYGSAVGADTNDPLLLEHDGTNYLYLPAVANNFASAPDIAAYDITGDIDIRVRLSCAVLPSSLRAFLSKWGAGGDQSFLFGVEADNLLRLYISTDGSNAIWVTSDFSIPTATPIWTRVTRRESDGRVQFFIAPDSSTVPTTWSQVGADKTLSSGSAMFISTSVLAVGSAGNSAFPTAGNFYRAQVISDPFGTPTTVFDADFTTGITSGSQTTFTESSSNAATVTINRSTSGRKSVAVVEDVWLFGTDDYLEVPDNALLDFGASDSFTVVAVVRQWATQAAGGRYLDKFGLALGGFSVLAEAGVGPIGVYVSDGPDTAQRAGTQSVTYGALSSVGLIVDRTTATLASFVGATLSATTTTAAVGAVSTTYPMRVGVRGDLIGQFQDFEFRAGAIFRRALTASEIALVNTHYTTGPTAASNRLLSESVWWIDAGRTAAAQINRSTSGRKTVACADCIWLLGTDDFFEVADNPLLDFAQVEDFTLLSLVRVWDFQGTNDALIAKSSSTTTNAAGYSLLNGGTDPLTETFRLGDGSNGAAVTGPARVPSRLVAVWAWRDTSTGLLHVALNNAASTTTADLTTGDSGNSLALRLGALSGTASEFLDAEMKSTAIWRRTLTASERAAVNYYYGTI